jgi:hypothetical protein
MSSCRSNRSINLEAKKVAKEKKYILSLAAFSRYSSYYSYGS